MDDDLEMQAYKLLTDPTPAPTLRSTRPASKMTANTRFLRHIVREAKSHNAALLARETADAQKRLNRLMNKNSDGENGSDDKASSGNGRKHETRHSHRHRSRTEDAKHDEDRHRRRRKHRDDDNDDEEQGADSRKSRKHRHHHSRHRDSSREDRSREQERKDRDRKSRHRHRRDQDRELGGNSEHDKDGRPSARKHSEHSRRRSSSPRSTKRHHRDRDHARDHERTRHRSPDDSDKGGSAYESSLSSDPLDDFVGPKPASDRPDDKSNDDVGIRIRGRGAHSATASGFSDSMDRHFAADYDPANDVEHPLPPQRPQVVPRTEVQEDSKGLLRDSAERLKAAGCTDSQQPGYTPWAKSGEAREWDRDKVDGNDGPVKPAWAR